MPEDIDRRARVTVDAQASNGDDTVKGLILQPGTYTPHVNGVPVDIRFTREAVLEAGRDLQRRVKRGELVLMRLTHPELDGLPIQFGAVTGVGIDEENARVYVTDSRMFTGIQQVLGKQGREKLFDLGLSVEGPLRLTEDEDGTLTATSLTVEAVDIVDQGAFDGSSITKVVPAGLAARLAAKQPGRPGACGRLQGQVTTPMPTFETVDDLPDSVRDDLTPDQQAVYLAAYNEAIEAGADPAQAHEAAMTEAQEATGDSGDEITPEPEEEEPESTAQSGDEDEDEEDNMDAKVAAKLAAKDEKIQELRKQLQAAKSKQGSTRDRLSKMEARLAKVEEHKEQLQAEKAQREAEDDVDQAIQAGRATPAERDALLNARKKLGEDDFQDLMASRGVVVPPGERGRQPQDPTKKSGNEAADMVARHGVQGVLTAGLHEINEDLAVYLAANHADNPSVQRALGSGLKKLAAKAHDGGDS